MSRRRLCEYAIFVGGALILLGSLPHALLGWPQLSGSLEGRIDAAIIGALGVGWHFGSVAMAALGAVAVLGARELKKGNRAGRWPPVVVGLSYLLFGSWALWSRRGNPHFLFFVLLGALVLGGALWWRGEPDSSDRR